MLPNVKQQINELFSNLEDDEFRDVHIDFVKHMGCRPTLLAELDNHVVLLREAFQEQIRSCTETIVRRGSCSQVTIETSPYVARLGAFATAETDGFGQAVSICDPPLEAVPTPLVHARSKLALCGPPGYKYAAEKIKTGKRQAQRAKKVPFVLAPQPNRTQDIKNLRALCRNLRGKEPLMESEGITAEKPLTRLRHHLEFTEDTVKKNKSAVHTLYLRIYAAQLAIAYQAYERAQESQSTAGSVNQPRRRRKRKPPRVEKARHARKCQRDKSLDWLTAQLYEDIDISNLAATDQRRVSVRYWLRIGEPLVPLFNYCPALLIAPGMQISQEYLMGVKKNRHQAFSDCILKAYAPFTDELSALNLVMYPLLQSPDGVPTLRVEQLTETDLSQIEELSFVYWTQFVDCPAVDVSQPSVG